MHRKLQKIGKFKNHSLHIKLITINQILDLKVYNTYENV